MEKLTFRRIDDRGPGLSKTHDFDAGYDLHCSEEVKLEPGVVYKIPTNVRVNLPEGTYGRVAERSSLAAKGIFVHGGVIDPNYTGEIICLMSSLNTATLNKNDKIAQLILEKVCICDMEESESLIQKDNRGENGFGSTGK